MYLSQHTDTLRRFCGLAAAASFFLVGALGVVEPALAAGNAPGSGVDNAPAAMTATPLGPVPTATFQDDRRVIIGSRLSAVTISHCMPATHYAAT